MNAKGISRRLLGPAALLALAACEEPANDTYTLPDGRVLNLRWLESETKEVANGREIGFVTATFDLPEWLESKERRPVAEQLCPLVLSVLGAPEQIDGQPLETVLIKYRRTDFEVAGLNFGSSSNYWVELNRGECVTQR